jgi:hypothetical protein
MTHDRITGYIDELSLALRARGAYSRDLVDEVRDHLLDSIEAARLRGLSSSAAEDEAVANIGSAEVVARFAGASVPRLCRALLLSVCLCTMCSVAYLTLSLLILRPPRASYLAWLTEAVSVVVLTAVTFQSAKTGGPSPWTHPILLYVGSFALAAVGGMTCYSALTDGFEGYGVTLGTVFGLQAVLTFSYLRRRTRRLARLT